MVSVLAVLAGSTWIGVQLAAHEIAPPERLALGGYTERRGALFEHGGDPLFVRTLVLESQNQKVIIASVEMLTIPESLHREVLAKLNADNSSGKPTALWLVATHTHCAPDSQMLNERMTFAIPGIASYRRRWLDWTSDAISRSIRAALASPQSRYPVLLLREFQANLNRPRRPNALPNTLAGELLAPGNRPLVAQYAAHATFYGAAERRLRGDWPGKLAEALGAPVLPGAIGDVSPDSPGDSPEQRIQSFVKTFTERARTAIGRHLSPVPFVAASSPVRLPAPAPHPEFARRNGLPQPLAESLNERFAPPKAEVFGVRIGKLAVIGVPGEPTAEIGYQIALAGRGMGFDSVWVISHVNGWIGYLLMPDDYARGGYEATLSFYGPDTGPRVVDAARATLSALRGTSPATHAATPSRMEAAPATYASILPRMETAPNTYAAILPRMEAAPATYASILPRMEATHAP